MQEVGGDKFEPGEGEVGGSYFMTSGRLETIKKSLYFLGRLMSSLK